MSRIFAVSSAILLGVSSAASAQGAWSGHYGVGVATMPRYAGSDEYRTMPIPIIALEYRERFFLAGSEAADGAGIGARLYNSQSLGWTVELAAGQSRRSKWADALAGMQNQSTTSFASTSFRYTASIFTATAAVASGFQSDFGTRASASLGATKSFARRWQASVSTGLSVATEKNMRREFGISDLEAASRQLLIDSGDPRLTSEDEGTYAPAGGLRDTKASVSLGYMLTQRTSALFFASGTRLSNEAARSPLTRERNYGTVGMGMVVGF